MNNLTCTIFSLNKALVNSQFQIAINHINIIGGIALSSTEKEIALTISELFSKDVSIIHFINVVHNKDEASNFKVALCDFILKFCTKGGSKLQPYCAQLKDGLNSIFTCSKPAAVKSATLNTLVRVLELSAGVSDIKSFELEKTVDKYYAALGTRPVPTILQGIYRLLGCIAKTFPACFKQYIDKFEDVVLKTLKSEMTSRSNSPRMVVIGSCFEAFTDLYVKFPPDARNRNDVLERVFHFGKLALNSSNPLNRYDIIRNFCHFLSKHSKLVANLLIPEAKFIFQNLLEWSQHANSETRYAASTALNSVLREIANQLAMEVEQHQSNTATSSSASASVVPLDTALFRFFIHQFSILLSGDKSDLRLISLAIRGFGHFSKVCRLLLSESDISQLFDQIADRANHLFYSTSSNSAPLVFDECLYQLPAFLEALANVATQLPARCLTENSVGSLVRLSVTLLGAVPRLSGRMEAACRASLLRVMLGFVAKPTLLASYLEGFVYHGVIRTCSHPPIGEADEVDSSEVEKTGWSEKRITHLDYLPIWRQILTVDTDKLEEVDITSEDKTALQTAIYDQLISSIVVLIDRLDLSYSSTAEESTDPDTGPDSGPARTDPTAELAANTPKDFAFLVNLVDFTQHLLRKKNTRRFQKWADFFISDLIKRSTERPLISGFYWLLSLSMSLCQELGFFLPAGMTRATTGALLHRFCLETLAALKQYKEELLAACITFLLSLPAPLVLDSGADQYDSLLNPLLPALRTAISLGVTSYLPLATTSLDALESWTAGLVNDPRRLRTCLALVLPCFEPLLHCQDANINHGTPSASIDSAQAVLAAVSRQRRDKRSLARCLRAMQQLRRRDQLASGWQSELALCQSRLLAFLGRLGGHYNQLVVRDDLHLSSNHSIPWSTTSSSLIFRLPLPDLKPALSLEAFLPRVVEVATLSVDLVRKLAACELFHSLVVVMVGWSKSRDLLPLWRRVFPAVIRLACDLNTVARNLFHPLLLQLIHWFSGPSQLKKEADCLLDSLMQSLSLSRSEHQTVVAEDLTVQSVDTNGAAERDLAGSCLCEFLSWSLRQSKSGGSGARRRHTPLEEKVLSKICVLAKHPSSLRRLGAALAFNSIYRVFREEKHLVDIYSFQILVDFIESITLAEKDEKSLGTQHQCTLALNHIERIILHYSADLHKPNDQRIKPVKWTNATYEICVRWLMTQCGRRESACRRACILLVHRLAGGIEGCMGQPVRFFRTLLESRGPGYFVNKFEAANLLDIASDRASLGLWMTSVLAALECYIWVLDHQLLPPNRLFDAKEGNPPKLVRSLKQFIDSVAEGQKWRDLALTPRERATLDSLRATIMVRVINLLTVSVSRYVRDDLQLIFPDWFWTNQLWRIIAGCLLRPTNLGFDVSDVETMSNLPNEWSALLKSLNKLGPARKAEFVATLKSSLRELNYGNLESLLTLSTGVALEEVGDERRQHVETVSLLESVSRVYQMREFSEEVGPLIPENMERSILDKVSALFVGEHKPPKLAPSFKNLCEKAMDCVLQFSTSSTVLVSLLSAPKGDLFYSTFSNMVDRYLASHAGSVIPELLPKLSTHSRLVCTVLEHGLEFVLAERLLRKRHGKTVVTALSSQWPQLCSLLTGPSATRDTKAALTSILTKMVLLDAKVSEVEEVFNSYILLLSDRSLGLGEKIKSLDMLAYFARSTANHQSVTNSNRLSEALTTLTTQHFPAKSSDHLTGSNSQVEFENALLSMLSALELSGSVVILTILIRIFCNEDKHTMDHNFESTLLRMMRRVPVDKQAALLNLPYSQFQLPSNQLPSAVRFRCLEKVCLPLLVCSSDHAVECFFHENIVHLLVIAESPLSDLSTFEAETRTGVFLLLCVLYNRLGRGRLHSPESRIVQQLCAGVAGAVQGNEMTKRITKAAHSTMTSSDPLSSPGTGAGPTEARRRLNCAAYNALCAVLMTTMTEGKFFVTFLLGESPAKGQLLLENLLPGVPFTFPAELERPLEKKRRFMTIRGDTQSSTFSDAAATTADSTIARRDRDPGTVGIQEPVQYIASQYLADSSLSTELSHFDRLAGCQILLSANQEARGEEPLHWSLADESSETSIQLEMDCVNQHECMPAMVTLFRHLRRLGVITQLPKGTVCTEIPTWMKYIHNKMLTTSSNNVKIFIAKLVINCEEIFRPYAAFWLNPLIQLIITTTTPAESSSSTGLNCLAVDLLVTLLSWADVAKPQEASLEDRELASRLVHFVVDNCYHSNASLMRNNLEILKTLVEAWKATITVPTKLLYENMTSGQSEKDTRSAIGVQMLGVFLANGFPFYSPTSAVDKKTFLRALSSNLAHPYKQVHAAAFEVVGVLMAQCKGQPDEDSFLDALRRQLTELSARRLDVFVLGLSLIGRHWPDYTVTHLANLRHLIPQMDAASLARCIQLLTAGVEQDSRIFLELKNIGFFEGLNARPEEVLLTTFPLLSALLASKTQEPVDNRALLAEVLLTAGLSCADIPHPAVRRALFEMLKVAYTDSVHHDKTSECRAALISGLIDPDPEIQHTVHNFLTGPDRLSQDTGPRALALLTTMFTPAAESGFLHYTTSLLLEMTARSPDYRTPVFPEPLTKDCVFREMRVEVGTQKPHTMRPLFLSQSESSQFPSSQSLSTTSSAHGVQATQAVNQLAFAPTQQAQQVAYNWLTEDSLAVSATISSTLDARGNTIPGRQEPKSKGGGDTASFLFPMGPRALGGTRKRKADTSDDDQSDLDTKRLRRRFLRPSTTKDDSTSRSSNYFAGQNIQRTLAAERTARDSGSAAAQQRQLCLYRDYREGDVPDVQIPGRAVVVPLQALAKQDAVTAGILFTEVYRALVEEYSSLLPDTEFSSLLTNLLSGLESVLKTSGTFPSGLVGAALQLGLLWAKQGQLDAAVCASAAIEANQRALGALLLETYVIASGRTLDEHETSSSTTAKRRRKVQVVPVHQSTAVYLPSTTNWELVRIYRSAANFDDVIGLFSQWPECIEVAKGLQAEASGDYKAAECLYEQLLQKDFSSHTHGEDLRSVCQEGLMTSLDRLSRWEDLERVSTSLVSADGRDLATLWERIGEDGDVYTQEVVLPRLLRAKLNRVLTTRETDQDLLAFVERGLQKEESRALLESNFCPELALLFLAQEEFSKARHFCERALENVVQDWSNIGEFMIEKKRAKLQHLQPLAEVTEFLDFIEDSNNFQSETPVNDLIDKWKHRLPHQLHDSPITWNDVITNRCLYMELLAERLESVSGLDLDTSIPGAHFQLAEASASLAQGNLHHTFTLLKHTRRRSLNRKGELWSLWSHLFGQSWIRKTRKGGPEDLSENLNGLVNAYGAFGKVDISTESNLLKSKQSLDKGSTLDTIASIISSCQSILDDIADRLPTVAALISSHYTAGKSDELTCELLQAAYSQFECSVTLLTSQETADDVIPVSSSSAQWGTNESDAFVQFANFADQCLERRASRTSESSHVSKWSTLPSNEALAGSFVSSVLQGMKASSTGARLRFARALQLTEEYPAVKGKFLELTKQLPEWMFLLWLDQLVSSLDKEESSLVQDILVRVASAYPLAIVYPLYIFLENFQGDTSTPAISSVVDRLWQCVKDLPLIHQFIGHLTQFNDPAALFNTWAKMYKSVFTSANPSTQPRKQQAIEAFAQLYSDVFEPGDPLDSPSKSRRRQEASSSLYDVTQSSLTAQRSMSGVPKGEYRQGVAKHLVKDAETCFGNKGSKLVSMKGKDFQKAVEKFKSVLQKSTTTPPTKLVKYSQWLAEYNSAEMSAEHCLELPGQYSGWRKPTPERHLRIAKFGPDIMVLRSKEKPKKLTVICTDTVERCFLVKGGDDLRQDARIQQCFQLANRVIAGQGHGSVVPVRTYEVLPISKKLGLIAWIDDTVVLKSALEEAMTPKQKEDYHRLAVQHINRMPTTTATQKTPQAIVNCWKTVASENMAQYVDEVRAGLEPCDLLRKAYQKMATSPETFYQRKSRLVKSHASLCILHYILGIGDRHLGNFLICQRTGDMIGIDFGYAFGLSTMVLPIPELLPFRVTWSLEQMMQPAGVRGAFRQDMIRVLGSIRENSQLLMATLQVFMKEINLDWIYAGQLTRQSTENFSSERIQSASRRLHGDNPSQITLDDVAVRNSKEPWFPPMRDYLLQLKDVSSSDGGRLLTCEEQVDALLMMARDTQLLGRCYNGWEPFL